MIYVVEDDPGVLALELYALRQAGYEAEGFACAADFRAAVRAKVPQLALLDVMLPGEDGLSLLRALRAQPETRRLPVIMVTAKDGEMDKVQGLDGGADDYLTKPFGVMELLARIRAALRRSEPEARPKALTVGEICLDFVTHRVTSGGAEVALTHMEFELLAFLMRHRGQAVTREMLLDEVWGIAYAGDTRTVDVHIRTLRQKLGDAGAQIATLRGVGYRMEERAGV